MRNIAKLTLVAVLLAMSSVAYADCSKSGNGCPKSHCGKGMAMSSADMCPVISKFLKKSDFFLDNQKAIGLTDEQVQTIKALRLKVDKIVVAEDAGMKTFALDLNAKMAETKVDVEGINAMIDGGMTGMASQTKEVVAAYAEMKGLLTAEQMAKAKEIWIAKSSAQCEMKK